MKPIMLFTVFLALLSHAFTQTEERVSEKNVRIAIPELKYKFNASGTHYIKASLLGQTWVRYSEMNPGTMIYDSPADAYMDIGLRRLRFSMWAQITDKLFFYTQFGQNNFSFLSKRHTGAFFHDAVTEYNILPQLSVGGGLTGWNGLSRYASPSIGSMVTLDAPLYQQVTNGVSDQFVRKLSVYAKGQLGKLDYRLSIASPMAVQNSVVALPAISEDATYSATAPKLQSQTYIFWQFFDKESNTLPYMAGTYLGKKKILNIGAGYIHQKEAMWHLNTDSDTVLTDMLLLGADIFLDLPLSEKGNTLTVYAAFNHLDFGPNHLRNVGVMNPATGTQGTASFNGAGVGFPMIGTGAVLYGQAGYKFRDRLTGEGTLQPFLAGQFARFEKLNDPMLMLEAGLNWLIHGTHNGKLSLCYQSRPVFEQQSNEHVKLSSRKGMTVVQYQISL